MDYEAFLIKRLAQLRLQKGVSARDMSLSIGQSSGYINKIESGQNLPSMTGFFYICEYLGITPQEFFDLEKQDPKQLKRLAEKLSVLPEKQLTAVEMLIDSIEGA